MNNILNNISLKAKLLTLFLVPFIAFLMVSAFFVFRYFSGNSTISTSEFTLTTSFIVVISIITLLIYFFIVKNILNSLNSINGGLNRFFNYLTSTEKNLDMIDLKSNDDFGIMAKNLNENIKKIKDGLVYDNEVINEAKFVSKMIGKGFLVYRINSTANNTYINELKDSINHMIDNLRIDLATLNRT